VQDAFWIVLVVVVIGASVVAVITLGMSAKTYEQIGRGGLSLRDGSDRPAHEPPAMGSSAALAERDDEIRQMLEARNERRRRRGDEPLDVDAEIARLSRPAVDPGLAAEVRQLVQARNARLVRRGEAPLDVETEVERRLRQIERGDPAG
jgi:hypothetical protein